MENKFLEYDRKFDKVFDELQNKKESEFKQKIFFQGQIYDAYSLIIDIIKRTISLRSIFERFRKKMLCD